MSESIQKLTHVEHILKRPGSYVGPVSRVGEQYWVKVVWRRLSSTLLKIFDEILVNAIDRNSLYPKQVTSISVKIDREKGEISIENNGPLGGIEVKEHEKEKIWNPELTFGHLLTSTNYDDSQQRVVGGRNGYGANDECVFKQILHKIKDSENKTTYTQEWSITWRRVETKCVCYAGATSEFASHSHLTGRDLVCLRWTITFSKSLKSGSMMRTSVPHMGVKSSSKVKRFQKLRSVTMPNAHEIWRGLLCMSDRWSVCVVPSEDGLNKCLSWMVSVQQGWKSRGSRGGYPCVQYLDEMAKKIKLKPQQVKNSFMIFVRATLVNPTFSSQVKSECTLKPQEFGSKLSPRKLIKDILKTVFNQNWWHSQIQRDERASKNWWCEKV